MEQNVLTMQEKWAKLFNKKVPYEDTLKRLREDFDKTWTDNFPSPFGSLEEDFEQLQVIGAGSFGTVVNSFELIK